MPVTEKTVRQLYVQSQVRGWSSKQHHWQLYCVTLGANGPTNDDLSMLSDPLREWDYFAKLRRTLQMQNKTEDVVVVVLVGLGTDTYHIDGSMQKRHNSIANALELRLSRIN